MKEFCLCAIPFVVSIVCYLNSLDGQMVHDDIPAIVNNKDLRPERSLSDIFVNDYWGRPMSDKHSHKSYRPITILTFRLNYMVHGLRPIGYHVVNVLTHGVVSSLFAWLCYVEVFYHTGYSLLAGVLFAIHPIHTEVVANIVSRSEILCAIFFLLSFISFRRNCYERDGTLVTCIFLAFIAMLCKEQGVTVLGISLFHLIISSSKSHFSRSHINNIMPRFVTITSSIAVIMSIRLTLLHQQVPQFRKEDNPASFHECFLTRLLSHWYIYFLNAWLLLRPETLSHDWQFGTVPLVHELNDKRNFCTLLFIVILTLRSHKAFTSKADHSGRVGLLFLIIPFLPSSNLLFTVGFVIAERTLYIPSMGYIILLVDGIQHLNGVLSTKKTTPVVIIVLMSFASKTAVRNLDWRSREALTNSGIDTFPHNAKMQFNYANVIRDHGLYTKSEHHYREAIRLWPDYASAHNNLATLILTKNTSAAKHHFSEAIRACPQHANAHFNLGTQLWVEGYYTSAEAHLKYTLQIDPQCVQCHLNLASLYCDTKNVQQAIVHFEKAINMDVQRSVMITRYMSCLQALNTSDISWKIMNQSDRALTINIETKDDSVNLRKPQLDNTMLYQKIQTSGETLIKRSKQYESEDQFVENTTNTHVEQLQPKAILGFALLLARGGQYKQAVNLLEEIVDVIHENYTKADIYFVIGECHKDAGNIQSAITAFKNTLILSHSHASAHHNLAVAYHYQNDVSNARYHYNVALQLEPTNDLLQQNYKKFQNLDIRH